MRAFGNEGTGGISRLHDESDTVRNAALKATTIFPARLRVVTDKMAHAAVSTVPRRLRNGTRALETPSTHALRGISIGWIWQIQWKDLPCAKPHQLISCLHGATHRFRPLDNGSAQTQQSFRKRARCLKQITYIIHIVTRRHSCSTPLRHSDDTLQS